MINPKTKRALLLITYGIVLFLALSNWKAIVQSGGVLISVVTPFLYGIIIAYLLNGPYLYFREKLYARLGQKQQGKYQGVAKGLSIVTAYIAALLVLTVIILNIVPQLIISIKQLGDNFSQYVASFGDLLNDLIRRAGLSDDAIIQVENKWMETIQNFDLVGQLLAKASSYLIGITKGITVGVYQWFIGIIVSIYLLAGKEKLLRQLQKLLYACAPQRYAEKVMKICTLSNKTFGRFIIGRITDAGIVMVLCFIGMTILRMPYAVLISVIIGVTNVIPVLGPFIGAIPSIFILLMVDPIKGLWFAVYILVLQQIDGNLIEPRVVGSSIGLTPIWVMFGVIVGGGLFGAAGMVIGVPTLAVLYTIVSDVVNRRLEKKSVSLEEEDNKR